MFACPGESDKVLYTCDGMNFRSSQPAYSGADQGFQEERGPEELSVTIPVPEQLAGKVIGKGKANIQMLRAQTKCKISIVKSIGYSNLLVVSNSQEKLDAAVQQINAFIDTIKTDSDPTHFVAIPCVSDKLFVHGDGGIRGWLSRVNSICPLSNSAWDNLNRLHFTLLMLRLEESDCERVQGIINDVVAHFDWHADTEVEIVGFNSFGNDKDGPRLFYAQPRYGAEIEHIKKLRDALAVELRAQKVDVCTVVDEFHITVLRRNWTTGGVWAGQSMLELAAEFGAPNAPLDGVSLCRRFIWKPGEFYYTYGKAELQSTLGRDVTFE